MDNDRASAVSPFIYLSKAQSTAQGHLGACFAKNNLTEVENYIKHAHFTKVKHNPKVSPFGIALVTNEK